MAGITIERQGRRIYLLGDTYQHRERIKSVLGLSGTNFDRDRRAWWCGAAKEEAARALAAELNGQTAPALAAVAGLKPDTPAGVVADKLEEDGQAAESESIRNPPKPKEDPHQIRLTGKGRYKGREYYAGAMTRDGTRVRLLTLPDAKGDYLDFWAPCSEVEQTKNYQPREVWDGRRYSGRTRTVYQTLGGIADFIARERRNRRSGGDVCAACGVSGDLIVDHEDGMMKHRKCCDIPSE